MTKSTLLSVAMVTTLGAIVGGCASDTAIESASFAQARSLAAPAEFTNAPKAAPLSKAAPKAAAKLAKSERRIDKNIQQAAATMPNEETDNHQTLTAIARLTERRGQIEQAASMYEAILAKEPNNPMPYHRLAVIAAQRKQWSDSERLFRKAYTMARPSSELLSDMGYLYYLRSQLDEARQLSQRALQLDPKNATAHNNLGLVYGEQGLYAESLAAFKRAVPTAEAHANLAFVLAQAGQSEQALAHYSQSLTLDDGLRPSARAMLQLAERQTMNSLAAERQVAAQALEVPIADLPQAEDGPASERAIYQAAQVAEPEYDAVTIDDLQRLDRSAIAPAVAAQMPPAETLGRSLVAQAHVPEELALPKSAPADRVYPSVAERTPTASSRPAATIDLAEELASYLEHSALEASQRPPQPTAQVRPLVAETPVAKPKTENMVVAVATPTEPPQVAQATEAPVVAPTPQAPPAGPTPEEIAAAAAYRAKQQVSRQYQPANNTLDIDSVASSSGSYRPRSLVGKLRPTRQPTEQSPEADAQQVSHVESLGQPVAALPAVRPEVSQPRTRQSPVEHQQATLDFDRLPEPSRWDRSTQAAPPLAPEVSHRVAPRPVPSDAMQPFKVGLPSNGLPAPRAAAPPTIRNHSAAVAGSSTFRFVSDAPAPGQLAVRRLPGAKRE